VSRCPSFGEHSKTDLAVSEQQDAMIGVFARCDPDETEQDGSEFERVDVLLEPPSVLDDGGPVLGSESWDHVVGCHGCVVRDAWTRHHCTAVLTCIGGQDALCEWGSELG